MLGSIALVVSFVLVTTGSAAASDNPPSTSSTVSGPASWADAKTGTVKHGTAVTTTTTKTFQLKPQVTGRSSAALDAGCTWNPQEDVTAYYFAGILDHVSVLYSNPVDCAPDLADFIFNNIRMIWNNTIDDSSLVTDNCIQGPCTHTDPAGTYLCANRILCAGTYEAESNFTITLLPGYYWPEPAPPYCTISGDALSLICDAFTGQVNVPETN